MITRRDLFRQVAGAAAVAAAPILAGATLAQRLINPGLSMPTWRLVERRMGAEMFSTAQAATRANGYLGWFTDKKGEVVGWLRADGALLKWTTRGGRDTLARIGTAVPMDHRNPVNW